MITTLGTTIPLHILTNQQIDAMRIEGRNQISSIQQEMKDFHGRLCAIEERQKCHREGEK